MNESPARENWEHVWGEVEIKGENNAQLSTIITNVTMEKLQSVIAPVALLFHVNICLLVCACAAPHSTDTILSITDPPQQ